MEMDFCVVFCANTDANNMSRACSLLARSTRTSVLEVTTTEVGLVLEVGGIVR
jgi:hypothetical protein